MDFTVNDQIFSSKKKVLKAVLKNITVIHDMGTLGPVDREYVLFNKIKIYFQNDYFLLK